MTDFIKCLKCGRFKKETLEVYGSDVRQDNWNEKPCECDEEKGFLIKQDCNLTSKQ